MNLNNIEKDKIAGFGSCAVLAWSVSRVLRACGVQTPCCLLTGFSVAVIAGVAKELWDKCVQDEVFDFTDIQADVYGSMAGVIMSV